ncbi:unnamed protein product, partial [Closterium sp. Yama58-4]
MERVFHRGGARAALFQASARMADTGVLAPCATSPRAANADAALPTVMEQHASASHCLAAFSAPPSSLPFPTPPRPQVPLLPTRTPLSLLHRSSHHHGATRLSLCLPLATPSATANADASLSYTALPTIMQQHASALGFLWLDDDAVLNYWAVADTPLDK